MRKKDDFLESYNTAEWQRKKNRILERDNYTCQICGDTESAMQVHHISYKHCNGKAYNALDGELITLCEKCHLADDGDHSSFYCGYITLLSKFDKDRPVILINDDKEIAKKIWMSMKCFVLICFKLKGHNYWNVGFKSDAENNWFEEVTDFENEGEPYVQGQIEYNDWIENFGWADDEQAEKFIRMFNAKDYVQKDKNGFWIIDKEKYEQYKGDETELW